VLEYVPRTRQAPALVQPLVRNELLESLLELGLVETDHRPQHLVCELPPEHRAHLRHLAQGRQAIRRAINESWSVAGIEMSESALADDIAHHHRPGRHPHAYRQVNFVPCPAVFVQGGHRLHHRQARSHRPPGVILVRPGIPEIDEHAVPHVMKPPYVWMASRQAF
jgi:hypothetical protein